jgi:hypothetical protein
MLLLDFVFFVSFTSQKKICLFLLPVAAPSLPPCPRSAAQEKYTVHADFLQAAVADVLNADRPFR